MLLLLDRLFQKKFWNFFWNNLTKSSNNDDIRIDIIIVAAFGQIIPKEVLELPKFGCINIHASLLPKYRGAAPIQQAVIDGEKESGVTIMQMGEGLDTGDMISKIVIPLSPEETGGSLFGKLAQAGAELLIKTLPSIEQEIGRAHV